MLRYDVKLCTGYELYDKQKKKWIYIRKKSENNFFCSEFYFQEKLKIRVYFFNRFFFIEFFFLICTSMVTFCNIIHLYLDVYQE